MADWGSSDRPDFDRLGELLPPRNTAAAKAGRGAAGTPAGAVPSATQAADELSQRLAAVWVEVVGAEVAENARPVQLRDGRLVVTTSSSAWAQTLQFMGPMIAAGLNERLGEGSVKRTVFRHAGWDVFASLDARTVAGDAGAGAPGAGRQGRGGRKPGRRAAPDASVPQAVESAAAPGDWGGYSAEEKQALADLEELPLAPSTKETIREAMKAGFARAKQDSGRS